MPHSLHIIRTTILAVFLLVLVPTLAVAMPLGGDNCDLVEPEPLSQRVAVESPQSGYVDPENIIDCFYEEFANDPLCAGAAVGATL